jgi:hypothetical protein
VGQLKYLALQYLQITQIKITRKFLLKNFQLGCGNLDGEKIKFG